MYFLINVTVSRYPIFVIFLILKNRPIRWRTLYKMEIRLFGRSEGTQIYAQLNDRGPRGKLGYSV